MGLSDMEIQNHLRKAGWDHDDINQLLVKGYAPLAGSSVSIDPTLHLPSFQELIQQAWPQVKKHRKRYIVIALLFAITGVVLYFISSLLLGGAYFGFGLLGMDTIASNQLFSTASGFGLGLLFSLFMGALGSLLFAWMQATFITMLTTTVEEFVLGDLLRTSFKKIIPYWWITVLMILLICGASYLFIVPGIIFSVWFSFSIFLPSSERTHGMMALLKSKEYIRGIWWQVFGRYAALYGLMAAIVFVLIIGIWIVSIVGLGSLDYPAITLLVVFLFAIAVAFVCALFVPFALSFSYTLYQRTRLAKKDIEVNPFMSSKGGLIATAVSGWIALPITFIIIIGLTTGLYGDLLSESRNATRQADIYTIHNALELYYEDNELYPQHLSTLISGYIELLPTDPDTYAPYTYHVNAQRDIYSICTSLEPTEDVHEQIFCLDQEGNKLTE